MHKPSIGAPDVNPVSPANLGIEALACMPRANPVSRFLNDGRNHLCHGNCHYLADSPVFGHCVSPTHSQHYYFTLPRYVFPHCQIAIGRFTVYKSSTPINSAQPFSFNAYYFQSLLLFNSAKWKLADLLKVVAILLHKFQDCSPYFHHWICQLSILSFYVEYQFPYRCRLTARRCG